MNIHLKDALIGISVGLVSFFLIGVGYYVWSQQGEENLYWKAYAYCALYSDDPSSLHQALFKKSCDDFEYQMSIYERAKSEEFWVIMHNDSMVVINEAESLERLKK